MSPPLVEIRDAVKEFASVRAVDGVSLAVAPGEIVALLGPNGAGKSTTLRMLLGLLRPDRGEVVYRLDGVPAPPDPARLGFLPEDRGLYPDVSVLRTLEYFGALRGMRHADARAAARRWLERLSLDDRRDEPLKALSKGNQQKVQFISALLHEPRFAVLDEPFSGLDPLNQELFLSLIRELRDGGCTILLSAHQMQLVERIADRVVVMSRGRVVLEGTMEEIRARWTPGTRLRLTVAGAADLGFLDAHPTVRASAPAPGEVELLVEAGASLGPVLAAVGERLDVRTVESRAVSLHEVYVRTVLGADASEPEPGEVAA